MTVIGSSVGPPLVVALFPLTLTLAVVLAFILLIVRRGWFGYRGLLGSVAVTVLALGPLRVLLFAGLNEVYGAFGPGNLDVILWGGFALSLVTIFGLAVLIRRAASSVSDEGGIR